MKKKYEGLLAVCGGILSLVATNLVKSSENIDLRGDFHPREEVVYGHRAALERQEDQYRKNELKQYQQQQYFEQQRSIEQQNLYNQTHQIDAARVSGK